MKDKRDECGCHRGCVTFPHTCEAPCRWPACLTDAEREELLDEVDRELLGDLANWRPTGIIIPPTSGT